MNRCLFGLLLGLHGVLGVILRGKELAVLASSTAFKPDYRYRATVKYFSETSPTNE